MTEDHDVNKPLQQTSLGRNPHDVGNDTRGDENCLTMNTKMGQEPRKIRGNDPQTSGRCQHKLLSRFIVCPSIEFTLFKLRLESGFLYTCRCSNPCTINKIPYYWSHSWRDTTVAWTELGKLERIWGVLLKSISIYDVRSHGFWMSCLSVLSVGALELSLYQEWNYFSNSNMKRDENIY